MSYLNDPIVTTLLVLTLMVGFFAMNPSRRPDLWLPVLTVALFALPRAGFVLSPVNLPLPVAHILVVLCIIEWLVLRHNRNPERSNVNLFFVIYAAMVGVGLAVGLSTGGHYRTAFLELCFYLFAIGLFFYASETFNGRRHNATVDLPGLPGEDVVQFCHHARREFYLRRTYIFRKLAQSLTNRHEARRNLKAFKRLSRFLMKVS